MTERLAAGVLALLAAAMTACSGIVAALDHVQDMPLPGAASRFDYQALDAGANRVYIARIGDGTVHVVDLAKGTVAGTVSGTPSVHRITLAPGWHLLLATVPGKPTRSRSSTPTP
jgi:hypothetical protein